MDTAIDKYLLNKKSVVEAILSPENNHFRGTAEQLTFVVRRTT
jgi:hypothetical protein